MRRRRVIHDREYERVRAGGVERESFERVLTALVTSAIVLAAAVAVRRVARWLAEDGEPDPMQGHILLRLVALAERLALVAVILLVLWLALYLSRDVGARFRLRRQRRDPLA